jgi:hypothetical protein
MTVLKSGNGREVNRCVAAKQRGHTAQGTRQVCCETSSWLAGCLTSRRQVTAVVLK